MDFAVDIDLLHNALNVYTNSLDSINNNITELDSVILSIKWQGASQVSFLEKYDKLRSKLIMKRNEIELLIKSLSDYIQDLNYVMDNFKGL